MYRAKRKSMPYLLLQPNEKLDRLVSNIQAVSSTQNKQRTSILPMLIASGKRDTKVGYSKYGITSSVNLSKKAELHICGSEMRQTKQT